MWAVRYRLIVVPAHHAAAVSTATSNQFPRDLPRSWPADCGLYAPANPYSAPTVIPLFTATPAAAVELSPSLRQTDVVETAAPKSLFKPLTQPGAVVLGRPRKDGQDGDVAPTADTAAPRFYGVLGHAYASREHLSAEVTVDALAYNQAAVREYVTVRLLGKNPIFVNGEALVAPKKDTVNGQPPTKAFKNAFEQGSNGAPILATKECLQAADGDVPPTADELRLLAASQWHHGAGRGSHVGLRTVRLVLCGRIAFPAEFQSHLPIILVVAEVVGPSLAVSSDAPRSAVRPAGFEPTVLISSNTIDEKNRAAMDSDATQDESDSPPPPARRQVQLTNPAPPPLDTHAAASAIRDGMRVNPHASSTPQRQATVGGFTVRPSSSDDDDSDASPPPARRMSTASLLAAATSTTAPHRDTNKVDAWATAVFAGGTAQPVLTSVKGAGTASSAAPRKPRASSAASPPVIVKLPSSDDVPLVSAPPAKAKAALDSSPPQAAKAAPPTLRPANSITRVATADSFDDDDVILSPPPPAKRPPRPEVPVVTVPPVDRNQSGGGGGATVWCWKVKRSGSDSDPSSWQPYPEDQSAAIAAAQAAGQSKVTIGSSLTVVLAGSPNAPFQYTKDPAAWRSVKAWSRASFPATAMKPSAAAAGAAPTVGAAKWEWKSNVDAPDTDPRAWRSYDAADSGKLEAAFGRGADTVVLSNTAYAVVFEDRRAGMAQYRQDDPSRWRSVRRVGGPAVARSRGGRGPRIIEDVESDSSSSGSGSSAASSSSVGSDSSRDSWGDSSDSAESSGDESTHDSRDGWQQSSSSSDSDGSRKKKKTKAKAAAKPKAPSAAQKKRGPPAAGVVVTKAMMRADSRLAPGGDRYVGEGSWLAGDDEDD